MPKRARSGAAKESKAKKRAIARYGADAVAKYYTPMSGRLVRRNPGETGYVDLASSTFNCDATSGTITLIATVAQGTTVNQRVGKKIQYKSLQIRGFFVNNSAATSTDNAFIIVYDKRPTGSLPAITDILDTISSRSFNKDDNSGRFTIVRRWDFTLVGNPTTFTNQTIKSFDHFINLRGRPAVFKSAGTGAIGDIEEGALYAVSVGTTASGTTACTGTIGMRTRFVDV